MFRYTVHNIVGHPIMEICYLLGLKELGTWVHDVTLPKNHNEDEKDE